MGVRGIGMLCKLVLCKLMLLNLERENVELKALLDTSNVKREGDAKDDGEVCSQRRVGFSLFGCML